jgi:hypothetical protein
VCRVGRAKYDVSSLDGTPPPTDTRVLCAHVCRVQVFAFGPGTNFLLAIPCLHVPLPRAKFWLSALSFSPHIISLTAHSSTPTCRHRHATATHAVCRTWRDACAQGAHAQLPQPQGRGAAHTLNTLVALGAILPCSDIRASTGHTSSHCASTVLPCSDIRARTAPAPSCLARTYELALRQHRPQLQCHA